MGSLMLMWEDKQFVPKTRIRPKHYNEYTGMLF